MYYDKSAVIKEQMSEQKFLKEAFLSLSKEEGIPLDIYKSEFGEVTKTTKRLSLIKVTMTLNYSCMIGTKIGTRATNAFTDEYHWQPYQSFADKEYVIYCVDKKPLSIVDASKFDKATDMNCLLEVIQNEQATKDFENDLHVFDENPPEKDQTIIDKELEDAVCKYYPSSYFERLNMKGVLGIPGDSAKEIRITSCKNYIIEAYCCDATYYQIEGKYKDKTFKIQRAANQDLSFTLEVIDAPKVKRKLDEYLEGEE
ncbi:MAG: hypothetical protein II988_02005 [Clostridia bacterium]|nr:hypothetical protein [Clostridia bacterium]